MKEGKEFTHFAALDWAKNHHDVIVVDRYGTVVADFRIAHDCAGWQSFTEKLRGFEVVAVAIETSEGANSYSPLASMSIRSIPRARGVTVSASDPAAQRQIESMPGVWLMPCVWMVMPGASYNQLTLCCRSCVSFVATRLP